MTLFFSALISGMSEKALLEKAREYGFSQATLADLLRDEPEKGWEIIRSFSYHEPEIFFPDAIEIILSCFSQSPGSAFNILQNLASSLPERAASLMAVYLAHFDAYSKEAIADFYYVACNHPELVSPEFVKKLVIHIGAAPTDVIMTFRHILEKRPELIREEAVRAVIGAIRPVGANQAFYFLRDLAVRNPEYTALCTLALFECVIAEHHYAVKREMIADIQSIAALSHVRMSLERDLKKPPRTGSPEARTLMAMLFRQRFRVQQDLLLQSLDYIGRWPRLWDFFAFFIKNSGKRFESAPAERFAEGAYSLHFILTPAHFEKLLVDAVNPADDAELLFPDDVSFLNSDKGLVDLYGKVTALASRMGADAEPAAIQKFRQRRGELQKEAETLGQLIPESPEERREGMIKREKSLEARLKAWETDACQNFERKALKKKVWSGLQCRLRELTLKLIGDLKIKAVHLVAERVLGYRSESLLSDPGLFPALFLLEKLGRGRNALYLRRLIEDRLKGERSAWLWTEPPVLSWIKSVKKARPGIRLKRWRSPFFRTYSYKVADAAREKKKRISAELDGTRKLFKRIKVRMAAKAGYEEMKKKAESIPADADAVLAAEIRTNLERVRRMIETPESDYEGAITLIVETDPFQYLFMGEYGFASCLSMHGSYFWSAVSNAIDVDKAVIWAKEPGGNIVGRRLIALTPGGIVSYRTYSNYRGLALDGFFRDFIREYAAHCNTVCARKGKVGPLLSDNWYDDCAV